MVHTLFLLFQRVMQQKINPFWAYFSKLYIGGYNENNSVWLVLGKGGHHLHKPNGVTIMVLGSSTIVEPQMGGDYELLIMDFVPCILFE